MVSECFLPGFLSRVEFLGVSGFWWFLVLLSTAGFGWWYFSL